MKKYIYLVNFDSQTLDRVSESFAVKGDGGIAELEFAIPSNFGVPANQALWRVFYKLPGEKESLFETLPTVTQTESGDYVTSWTISKAITQKAGRLAFSLAAISGENVQWNSRTVIMQVPESQYQPESEEAEEPYTGRLTALEGSMASIRGEWEGVQDEFDDLKEVATAGVPIAVEEAADMINDGHIYIYTGTEPGYTAGHVYYYVDGVLKDGGVYGGTNVDPTLTVSGAAADAKKTGDEIAEIKEDLNYINRHTAETVDLSDEYTDGKIIPYVPVGQPINTTPSALQSYGYVLIPCEKGDVFVITGGGGNSPRLWGFVDTNYIAVSWADKDIRVENLELTSPTDGYFISNAISAKARALSVTRFTDFVTEKDLSNVLSSQSYITDNRWEVGSINAATGTDADGTIAIRTSKFNPQGIDRIKTINGYRAFYYGFSGASYIGFFNGNTFQKSGSALNYPFKNVKVDDLISAGASAIRIMLRKPTDDTMTVSESENIYTVNNVISTIEQKLRSTQTIINSVDSPYNHGPFLLRKGDYNQWYTGLQENYNRFGENTVYAEVLTAFDELMTMDSAYVTKNVLGTASGVDANGNAYTLYEYVFKPKMYINQYTSEKIAKIYMDGSIHGFEKNSTFGMYYFLKDIVENWRSNPSLQNLRSNVEFHIIPVVNPYGFDRNKYVNGNGVNINRNFAHNGEWVVVTTPDTEVNGNSAFDQPESRIIRDWLLADKDNILMYFNGHTNGITTVGYAEMNACLISSDRKDPYFNKLLAVLTDHINRQSVVLPKMYHSLQPGENEMCGHIGGTATENFTKGHASVWANTMETILAMTLETFNGIVNAEGDTIIAKFSDDSKKMCSEIIGNLILQVVEEYSIH